MVGCGSSKLGPSFLVTTPRNFGECENTAWYRDVMTQISIKLHFTHPHAAIIRITAAGDTTLHTVFVLMSWWRLSSLGDYTNYQSDGRVMVWSAPHWRSVHTATAMVSLSLSSYNIYIINSFSRGTPTLLNCSVESYGVITLRQAEGAHLVNR